MSVDHDDQWTEDAGRGSTAVPGGWPTDWEDDLPSAGELAAEWIAENLPAERRRVFDDQARAFKDKADRDWAVGGPTCGGRLR